MAAFLKLLINRGATAHGRLLSPHSIDRMEHPQTTLAARSGLRYGYGLGNYQWLREGYLFHGHGGDADGYLAHYGYNRDTGLGYFIVINAFNGTALRRMRLHIERFIVKDLPPPEPLPPYALRVEHLQKYAGQYAAATHRFPWRAPGHGATDTLEILIADGSLHTRRPNRPKMALHAVSEQHFRRHDETAATAAFVDYAGAIYLQGDMGNYRRIGESQAGSTLNF